MQRLLESLRINKHYEQLHVWEEMLVEPIMKDMMREVSHGKACRTDIARLQDMRVRGQPPHKVSHGFKVYWAESATAQNHCTRPMHKVSHCAGSAPVQGKPPHKVSQCARSASYCTRSATAQA
eukprot:scaffold118453_cov26-Tisochrysis_lutea.AAC.1